MIGLITAFNLAYEQRETRGFLKLNLVAIALTVLMLVCGTMIIALVRILPAVLQVIGLESSTKWLLLVLEWPLLIAVVTTGLAVLYRYEPDRQAPHWQWVSLGAIVAAFLWLLGLVAFTCLRTASRGWGGGSPHHPFSAPNISQLPASWTSGSTWLPATADVHGQLADYDRF